MANNRRLKKNIIYREKKKPYTHNVRFYFEERERQLDRNECIVGAVRNRAINTHTSTMSNTKVAHNAYWCNHLILLRKIQIFIYYPEQTEPLFWSGMRHVQFKNCIVLKHYIKWRTKKTYSPMEDDERKNKTHATVRERQRVTLLLHTQCIDFYVELPLSPLKTKSHIVYVFFFSLSIYSSSLVSYYLPLTAVTRLFSLH